MTPSSSTDTQMRSLVEQARAAWVSRDVETLVQLFTADAELIVPGQRWQGQQQIRAELSQFAQQYSEVKIDIQRIIIDGNQAAVEWMYENVEQATGKCTRYEDAIILEATNGKIAYWREYFDAE